MLAFVLYPNSLMQSADFFRGDNPEGMEARNEVNVYFGDFIVRNCNFS